MAGLGLLAGCGQLPGQAPPAKIPRIGVLRSGSGEGSAPAAADASEALREGLGELGYLEGQNIAIEWRFSEGTEESARDLAAGLVRQPVDVIVAGGDRMVRAARQATDTVPIVMALSTDPVETGLIASLARPGGNMTGLTNLLTELAGKRLELLKAAVPSVSRVGAVGPAGREYQATKAAAAALDLQVELLEVRHPNDLEQAVDAARRDGVTALVVLAGPVTVPNLDLVAELAATRQLPAVTESSKFAREGGLMAYGPSLSSQWRRTAYYVDRILKGTKPADLPVEQPMIYEFVVNLKTARALGLSIPQHVLLQATEIIQ
jgi:putative ABC transport system substrate-binding protein